MTTKRTHTSWTASFLAITRYELLWNIRKKKLYGVIALGFVLATLRLFLPIVISNVLNQPLQADPNFAINTGTGIAGIGFFLFGLVTIMNSISGEFESGTIVPLLTKPISRTTVLVGKLFAAFVTLLGAYIVLVLYLAAGGVAVYGPQNNLQLLPIVMLGSIVSTFVWMSMILAVGTVSKSSMIAALVGIGLWLGITIVGAIFTALAGQSWVLTYLPGSGASGYAQNVNTSPPTFPGIPTGLQVATGTDNLATNLVTYVLHPDAQVTFYKIEYNIQVTPPQITYTPLYTETLSLIVAREALLALIYIVVFSFIVWLALKRAQVAE